MFSAPLAEKNSLRTRYWAAFAVFLGLGTKLFFEPENLNYLKSASLILNT